MAGLDKFLKDSLSFLDNTWVRWFLVALVILYVVGVLPMLTGEVLSVFQNPLVKLVALVFIVYVALKDLPLALLLGLAFVLSLLVGYEYQFGLNLGPGLSAGVSAGVAGDNGPSASVGAQASTSGVHASVDAETFSLGLGGSDDPEGGNFNKYSDCVKECAEGGVGSGPLDSPCKGVGVWKKEWNAQGLNCPLGYSGGKVGSPF